MYDLANPAEECEDGNVVDADGCNNNCTITGGYICPYNPDQGESYCYTHCGDGRKYTVDNEECDDSNTLSGDGCSSICVIEEGFNCTANEG